MRTLKKRTSATEQLENNLIPMINIIFLLLIFFMVAGQISQQKVRADLTLPESISKVPATPSTIEVVMTKDLTYLNNGEVTSLEGLQHFVSNIQDKTTTIRLQVDKTVKAGDLDQLLDVFRAANMRKVTLLTLTKGAM
jgi:biopolymer transport protein ExbD